MILRTWRQHSDMIDEAAAALDRSDFMLETACCMAEAIPVV